MGKTVDALRMDLFAHLELHEHIHRGDEQCIRSNVSYLFKWGLSPASKDKDATSL